MVRVVVQRRQQGRGQDHRPLQQPSGYSSVHSFVLVVPAVWVWPYCFAADRRCCGVHRTAVLCGRDGSLGMFELLSADCCRLSLDLPPWLMWWLGVWQGLCAREHGEAQGAYRAR